MAELNFKQNKFDDMKEGIVMGYASKFGNIDSDIDIIQKGAYSKTLSERGDRIKFVYQHDMSRPLGKPTKMEEDDNGLYVEAKISDTSLGRDVKTLIEDEVISEFSVGFSPIIDEFNKDTGIRTIKEIKLYEFSLVTLAANQEAIVTGIKSGYDPIPEINRLISNIKKMQTDEAKTLIEYELLKLQKYFSLQESKKDHSLKEVGNELDNLINILKK